MAEPQQFQHRPSVVRAMQLTAESTMDVVAWLPPDRYLITDEAGMPALWIWTPDGARERTYLGSWIVHEHNGFRVYSPSVFEQLYAAKPALAGYLVAHRDALGQWWAQEELMGLRADAEEDLLEVANDVPGADWRVLTCLDESGEPYRAGQPEVSGDA